MDAQISFKTIILACLLLPVMILVILPWSLIQGVRSIYRYGQMSAWIR